MPDQSGRRPLSLAGFSMNQSAESAGCAGECRQGAERVALEAQSRPTVAAVATLPELSVGEAGEQATVSCKERVRQPRSDIRARA
jgi:hypothetical protein